MACSKENCCFCIPLHVACSVLGFISLICSGFMVVAVVILIILDKSGSTSATAQARSLLQSALNTNISDDKMRIVLWVALATSATAALASVSLMLGTKKRRPGFVLVYFSYFVFLAIVYLLGAILLLIEKYWTFGCALIGVAMVVIHTLVVVYKLYDELQRGMEFGFAPHQRLLDAEISEPFTQSIPVAETTTSYPQSLGSSCM